MMPAYPSDFPVTQGLEIVSLLRSGQISSKVDILAYDTWLLQGYAQRAFFGDPNQPSIQSAADVDLAPFAAQNPVDVLERVCKMHDGDLTAQFAVPWQLILQWALGEIIKLIATNNA